MNPSELLAPMLPTSALIGPVTFGMEVVVNGYLRGRTRFSLHSSGSEWVGIEVYKHHYAQHVEGISFYSNGAYAGLLVRAAQLANEVKEDIFVSTVYPPIRRPTRLQELMVECHAAPPTDVKTAAKNLAATFTTLDQAQVDELHSWQLLRPLAQSLPRPVVDTLRCIAVLFGNNREPDRLLANANDFIHAVLSFDPDAVDDDLTRRLQSKLREHQLHRNEPIDAYPLPSVAVLLLLWLRNLEAYCRLKLQDDTASESVESFYSDHPQDIAVKSSVPTYSQPPSIAPSTSSAVGLSSVAGAGRTGTDASSTVSHLTNSTGRNHVHSFPQYKPAPSYARYNVPEQGHHATQQRNVVPSVSYGTAITKQAWPEAADSVVSSSDTDLPVYQSRAPARYQMGVGAVDQPLAPAVGFPQYSAPPAAAHRSSFGAAGRASPPRPEWEKPNELRPKPPPAVDDVVLLDRTSSGTAVRYGSDAPYAAHRSHSPLRNENKMYHARPPPPTYHRSNSSSSSSSASSVAAYDAKKQRKTGPRTPKQGTAGRSAARQPAAEKTPPSPFTSAPAHAPAARRQVVAANKAVPAQRHTASNSSQPRESDGEAARNDPPKRRAIPIPSYKAPPLANQEAFDRLYLEKDRRKAALARKQKEYQTYKKELEKFDMKHCTFKPEVHQSAASPAVPQPNYLPPQESRPIWERLYDARVTPQQAAARRQRALADTEQPHKPALNKVPDQYTTDRRPVWLRLQETAKDREKKQQQLQERVDMERGHTFKPVTSHLDGVYTKGPFWDRLTNNATKKGDKPPSAKPSAKMTKPKISPKRASSHRQDSVIAPHAPPTPAPAPASTPTPTPTPAPLLVPAPVISHAPRKSDSFGASSSGAISPALSTPHVYVPPPRAVVPPTPPAPSPVNRVPARTPPPPAAPPKPKPHVPALRFPRDKAVLERERLVMEKLARAPSTRSIVSTSSESDSDVSARMYRRSPKGKTKIPERPARDVEDEIERALRGGAPAKDKHVPSPYQVSPQPAEHGLPSDTTLGAGKYGYGFEVGAQIIGLPGQLNSYTSLRPPRGFDPSTAAAAPKGSPGVSQGNTTPKRGAPAKGNYNPTATLMAAMSKLNSLEDDSRDKPSGAGPSNLPPSIAKHERQQKEQEELARMNDFLSL
eukprot:TRINITY_DN2550_c0_g1_i1.p1 TRINITY_DN2550_c0_g1~~TRINITY_DN2550_c0_g1_i1.p1  ORF type:complete len:1174 (+),score=129.20 TRINITY_DN2550_c0_g1_i1:69-3524(+)